MPAISIIDFTAAAVNIIVLLLDFYIKTYDKRLYLNVCQHLQFSEFFSFVYEVSYFCQACIEFFPFTLCSQFIFLQMSEDRQLMNWQTQLASNNPQMVQKSTACPSNLCSLYVLLLQFFIVVLSVFESCFPGSSRPVDPYKIFRSLHIFNL